MKKLSRLIALCLFAINMLLCVNVLAHPGKTDEYGGHFDYEAGEYHYHHGYPAHQHENGECPYDFDDKTVENSYSSGYSSGATEHHNYREISTTSHSEVKYTKKSSFFESKIGRRLLLSIASIIVLFLTLYIAIIRIKKHIRRKRCDEYLTQLKPKLNMLKEEYAKYLIEYYSVNLLEEECNAPSNIKFENGKFKSITSEVFGKYTVYVSWSGSCIHKSYDCSGARIPKVSFLVPKYYRTCSKCCKNYDIKLLDVPEWYLEYQRVLESFKQFGISQSEILQKDNLIAPPIRKKILIDKDNSYNNTTIQTEIDDMGQMKFK